MKRQLSLIGMVALIGASLFLSGYFNASSYPQRYTSGAVGAASGSIATGGPLLLDGYEFANTNAAARSLLVFDLPASSCPPANGATAFLVFTYNCPASTQCSWGLNGPDVPQGGGAVVFTKGICWANSSTFPSLTIGGADSTVNASFRQMNQ